MTAPSSFYIYIYFFLSFSFSHPPSFLRGALIPCITQLLQIVTVYRKASPRGQRGIKCTISGFQTKVVVIFILLSFFFFFSLFSRIKNLAGNRSHPAGTKKFNEAIVG